MVKYMGKSLAADKLSVTDEPSLKGQGFSHYQMLEECTSFSLSRLMLMLFASHVNQTD